MTVIPENMALLDVLASYTRSGLLFCLMVQIVSIMLGKIFNKPTLQRLSIAITCTFAAFSAASYASNSHVGWVIISAMTFYVTYFLTPKFVGEA